MAKALAIDLGSYRTRIFDDNGKSLYEQETVASIDIHSNDVVHVGRAARVSIAENSGRLRLERPFMRGMAGSLDRLEQYLSLVLASIGVRSLSRVRLVISHPIGLSSMEREFIGSTLSELGAREILLVSSTLAGLLGCNVDPTEPEGVMVYSAGASVTEASIFSLGEMVSSASKEGAGNALSERVIRMLADSYDVVIAAEVAEEIVANLVDLGAEERIRQAKVWGRDAKTGEARQVRISEQEVADVLSVTLNSLYSVAATTLANCQAELVSDVASRGVFVVGGCVNMAGFGEVFVRFCNVNVTIPKSPELAVVRGLVTTLRGEPQVRNAGLLEVQLRV